jgi:hypothetical protein
MIMVFWASVLTAAYLAGFITLLTAVGLGLLFGVIELVILRLLRARSVRAPATGAGPFVGRGASGGEAGDISYLAPAAAALIDAECAGSPAASSSGGEGGGDGGAGD